MELNACFESKHIIYNVIWYTKRLSDGYVIGNRFENPELMKIKL